MNETTTPAPAKTAAPADRQYLLERVGEAAVVQVYADGFRDLPLREKTLIWHLAQAAIAGRDIFYDQRYAHNLEMRDVLEAIVTHAAGVDRVDTRRDHPLHQAVLDQHRPVQQPHVAQVRAGVHARRPSPPRRTPPRSAGARFPLRHGETLDALLARLQPMFFDPDVDPTVTSKTPRAGKDIVTASANNLYADVTMADLEGFEEKHPLNSRLVKRDGQLVEEVYRIGGRYGAQIAAIVEHLEAAMPFATEPMAKALRALDHVLPHRRRSRSRGVRHRLGAGQGVAGRHHQRLRRGLPRRAQHQGRVGSDRLLRQPREDVADSDDRGAGAVVRRPHAVGPEVPQGRRPRRHRQRHRHRDRDGGVGADHAGRHQPAQRSGDPRAVRQQVGVAVERERGVRSLDAAGVPRANSRGRRKKRRDRSSGTPSPAS